MIARRLAVALIPLALAACAGGASYTVFQQTGGVPDAPAGPVPLVVFGTPPDGSGPRAVAAAARMPAALGGAEMRLIEDASAAPRRMVLSFAPATPRALCRATGPAAWTPSGGTEASAAWCQGAEPLGGARMRTAAAGPGEAGFGRALTALYRAAVKGLDLYDVPFDDPDAP